MGEQTKKAPVPPTAREAIYVVQRVEEVEVVVGREVPDLNSQPAREKLVTEKRGYWTDVATVSVPSKSKRKTIIGLALVQAGVKPQPGEEPLRLRVLPEAAAAVTTVAARAVEPELELS